jgi:DNA-binding NarL/FixJ family response regulator
LTRVAIYDDSKPRRESLRSFVSLSPDLEFAGCYEHCGHVLKDVEATSPDLILMDIEMPVVDGLEGIRLVKAHFPHIKIIVQTAFDDDDKVFAALQLGAEGYILKSATVVQISQSISEVVNGGASMSPSIALKVMRYFGQLAPAEKKDYLLTRKETETLKHLVKGLSHKMIADAMNISVYTVSNHVKNIYEKLQVHSVGEALALAHKERLV